MFPLPSAPDPRPSRWAAKLRHSLDVVVAFATLRDPAPAPAARPAGSAAEPAARRRGSAHPHRRPLERPVRARRPGALPAASQPCRTPLGARRERRSKARAGRV
jgi:hypothetical protein